MSESWQERANARREFRQTKGAPETPSRIPKAKKSAKPVEVWSRYKEGVTLWAREHRDWRRHGRYKNMTVAEQAKAQLERNWEILEFEIRS